MGRSLVGLRNRRVSVAKCSWGMAANTDRAEADEAKKVNRAGRPCRTR